jgi:LuxR family maltose regulon positive regulatory protein
MPKTARYSVVWSQAHRLYDLLTDGVFQQALGETDEETWSNWLATHPHFAFQGQEGHLNVLKEQRPRGEGYWYAYTYHNQRKVKRYLGKTSTITLARLEEVAAALTHREETSVHAVETPTAQTMTFPALPAPLPPSMPSELALSPGFPLLPKLSPPRQPAMLVTRTRLLDQLNQILTHQLTLISASAGFGKTTLMSCWAAHYGCPIAWLSLEETDNEPLSFWSYVVAALRTQEPGIGGTALSMLQAPQPPALMTMLATLINDLTTVQRDMVLALDDFHAINHPTIISSIQFLLDHLPANLHLILAGRTDPPLTLPRLRARRQLIELRDQDLRFTRAEAALFLTRIMGFALQEADIDVLEQRVEGWIAGLQLVALAMRSRADYSTFVQQLSGSQRFVFDYMQDEVVERQPQEVQDFLLKTSILARLHAPLCQAVIAGSSEQASQQMLLTLEKANLFLIPLDEERRWYRLHSLFRDVLQARLQATAAELVPLLHQRAARWYAQQGDLVEAIEHALAGNDDAFAADLMERSTFKLTATAPSLPIPLTIREQEVFRLLVQGQKNREIADQLVISLPTAKKHVANILSKLGAENRAQALVRAHEYGLL